MTEAEMREKILGMVREYCDTFHNQKKDFKAGDRIPYASRVYDGDEMTNLVDSALDFWLTAGRYVDEFEKNFAAYLGVKFCSVVNSGSSANLVAFSALTSPLLGERQIRRGDEVITVAAGFPTTVSPIIQYGAIPVFVDVTIPQYNIDVTKLEAALSDKTRAVMIAHTLGNYRGQLRRTRRDLHNRRAGKVHGDNRRHRDFEFLSCTSSDYGRRRRSLHEQSETS